LSILAFENHLKGIEMKIKKSIFDIFAHDQNFQFIMQYLLQTSFAHSFNGILITEAGPGYPIIYANPAFCSMTGYHEDEIIGKSPSMLQGPDTDQKVLGRLKTNLENDELFHGQAINYRKDGSEFMMEWKIVPIKNQDGKTSHYLAIQREISPAD
jgi:PAS domain S-box-containing protein